MSELRLQDVMTGPAAAAAIGGTDVIVGFDGSPGSRGALRWAAAEAARSGARLRVVLAYHWRWPAAVVVTDRLAQSMRDEAEALVDAAADEARALRPGIRVSAHAVFGDAPSILLNLACGAAVLAVGHGGRDAHPAAVLGGTGGRVAARAHGTVVVVRGRPDVATGPVVVGVDGSADDVRLLTTSFEQAARRHCGVVVLRSFTPHEPPRRAGTPLTMRRIADRARLRAALIDDVQRRRDGHPAVPVEIRMPDGDPAGALIDASREAQLLVVGSRGYAGVAALMMGSVSRRLLHHCDCPLMIVRAPHDAG